MSDAADKLARTRLAIIQQIKQREQGPEYVEAERRGERHRQSDEDAKPRRGTRWFARFKSAARTWWRYHPAHMGLELATPVLSEYAARKPLQYLGIAAAVGAIVVIARPWRLVSVTGVLVAIAKSSQLSSVLLSAMSAAGTRDHEP